LSSTLNLVQQTAKSSLNRHWTGKGKGNPTTGLVAFGVAVG